MSLLLTFLTFLNTKNVNKRAYEDVTGLFQLDDEGYYYYNMRKI